MKEQREQFDNEQLFEVPSGRFIDIHCHCLEGLDDGPGNLSESLRLCKALVRDRVSTVIATPHQLGRYDTNNYAKKVRESVRLLNEELIRRNIKLEVLAGGEARVDERLCQLIKNDNVLTLGDKGKYLLLELPENMYIDIEPLIIQLSEMGIKVIIAHPERIRYLSVKPDKVLNWAKYSGGIQVTAGSLVGKFGAMVQKNAWDFVKMDLPVIIATDAHNSSSRGPCLRAAYEVLRIKLSEDFAQMVCVENPYNIVKGNDLKTVRSEMTFGGNNAEKQNNKRAIKI